MLMDHLVPMTRDIVANELDPNNILLLRDTGLLSINTHNGSTEILFEWEESLR